MRNKLIDGYGAYLHTTFTGENGTWTLVATETDCNDGVMQTLDTFKSDKGEYKTMTRNEVDRLFELGKIKL